jgi:hypothetical protein
LRMAHHTVPPTKGSFAILADLIGAQWVPN